MKTQEEIQQAAAEKYPYNFMDDPYYQAHQQLLYIGCVSGYNLALKDMDSEMCKFAEWYRENASDYWHNAIVPYSNEELVTIYKEQLKK